MTRMTERQTAGKGKGRKGKKKKYVSNIFTKASLDKLHAARLLMFPFTFCNVFVNFWNKLMFKPRKERNVTDR